jgi:hypothetical protein
MFFILSSFSGVLGSFEAGTEAAFQPSTAVLLEAGGHITPVGSAKHQAWLAAQGESAPETKPAPVEGATPLETKPEPLPTLETKPAPRKKAK